MPLSTPGLSLFNPQLSPRRSTDSQVVLMHRFMRTVFPRPVPLSAPQPAWSYLEAVRNKVPELIAIEKTRADYLGDAQVVAEEERVIMDDS